ncbi:unnamed protein product [Sphagnum jensenii]|uniref:Uncharacterized protein n=1 Tax=Sphagnum jensenii TaxID=128206 RepID=A0ABP0VAK9_9BRYO
MRPVTNNGAHLRMVGVNDMEAFSTILSAVNCQVNYSRAVVSVQLVKSDYGASVSSRRIKCPSALTSRSGCTRHQE